MKKEKEFQLFIEEKLIKRNAEEDIEEAKEKKE